MAIIEATINNGRRGPPLPRRTAMLNEVFKDAQNADHKSRRVRRLGESGRRGIFSSTGPVIAIFAGELFLGEAEGNLAGSGTIRIQSSTKPDVTCRGQFTSSAELGGAGSLLCSDSTTATIKFQRLSIFRGYGTGSSSRGPMSFTYGLSAIESEPYLKLPRGKALRLDGKDLVLVDVRQLVPVILPVTDPISHAPEAAPYASPVMSH